MRKDAVHLESAVRYDMNELIEKHPGLFDKKKEGNRVSYCALIHLEKSKKLSLICLLQNKKSQNGRN